MGFDNITSLKAKTAKMRSTSMSFIMNSLESGANTIRNNAVIEIQAAAQGKDYTRYAPKRTGIASAPGDAPHTDKGDLVNSVQVQRFDDHVDVGCMGEMGIHGKWLEYGTNRISARPWLAPATDAALPVINSKLQADGNGWIAEIIRD